MYLKKKRNKQQQQKKKTSFHIVSALLSKIAPKLPLLVPDIVEDNTYHSFCKIAKHLLALNLQSSILFITKYLIGCRTKANCPHVGRMGEIPSVQIFLRCLNQYLHEFRKKKTHKNIRTARSTSATGDCISCLPALRAEPLPHHCGVEHI